VPKLTMSKEKTVTAVKVTEKVWREIHRRKDIGKSADDVLREALGLPAREEANPA